MYTFSVITICKNEEKNIVRTMFSVLNQKYKNFEYIVVDGNSVDRTYELVTTYRKHFMDVGIAFNSISSGDGGIYQAMNKGIDLATGEYCIFMNAGDAFYDKYVLSYVALLLRHKSPDVLYGNTVRIEEDSNKRIFEHSDYRNIPWGCTICHQSSFIRTSLLKERKYDTKFALASDYEYWQYLYKNNKIFYHTKKIISLFSNGGASAKRYQLSQNEVKQIIDVYKENIDNSLVVSKNNTFYFDYKHNFFNKGIGWSISEWNGTWTLGNKSELFVNLKNTKDVYFYISVLIDNGYRNKLYVNDSYVSNIELINGKACIRIPKEIITKGTNKISIETNDIVRCEDEIYPEIKDHRKCNMYVEYIKILKRYNNSISIFDYMRFIKNGYIRRFGFGKKSNDGIWCIGNYTEFDVIIKKTNNIYELNIKHDPQDKEVSIYFNNEKIGLINSLSNESRYLIKNVKKGINSFKLILNEKDNLIKGGTKKYLYIRSIWIKEK